MSVTSAEMARARAVLGDGRIICDRCGATLWNYLDGSKCVAGLAEACPGFLAVEAAMKPESPDV